MQVWIVTVGEPLPTDEGRPRLLRSGALASFLAKRGHAVTWFNSAFDHTHKRMRDMPESFVHDEVKIELLKARGYRRNVSLARIRDQRFTARDFAARAEELPRPDVILCSLPTLELCAVAVAFERRHGVPALLDVRDLWPDVYYQAVPPLLRPLLAVALAGQERLANRVLRQASGIVGISPGYLAWGLRRARRDRNVNDHMIPLGYEFPPLSEQEGLAGRQAIARLSIPEGRPIVWYVGTFGHQYDLAPVIEAARIFDRSEGGPVFVLSGVGDREMSWRKLAEGLRNVIFTGWITRPEIGWLRAHAMIGLQPYAKGAPQGLANKTFEYLSAGLPIVSSLSGENAELITSNELGIFYEPGNAAGCHAAIRTILDDPSRHALMAMNARKIYELRFGVNAVFARLATALESAAAMTTAHAG